MNKIQEFKLEVEARIEELSKDSEFQKLSSLWTLESMKRNYVYNFSWLGRPIIQMPQDIIALQEIIWNTQPDLIIETGIAHGGSIIFSASMLKILGGKRKVVGIDIDIRDHNRREIEAHPVFDYIELIEGSSISSDTFEQVSRIAKDYKKVMVILDSNHTHKHVLEELRLYSQLVSTDMYLVVLDTFIEDLPEGFFKDRPWDVGNNSKTAVFQFLKENASFSMDPAIHNKLMLTSAPEGYLKKLDVD
jgi:cephalosporin hydroxylase